MWTVFKVPVEFVIILLLCYVLFFWPWGMWDPSSLTRGWTCTPPLHWRWSPNHSIAREVPCNYCLYDYVAHETVNPYKEESYLILVQFLSARPQSKYPVMEKWTNVLGIPFLSFQSEESVSVHTVLSHPERSVLIEKNFRRWTSSHQLFRPVFSCFTGGISTESDCAFEPDYAVPPLPVSEGMQHIRIMEGMSRSLPSSPLLTHQSISVRLQPVKKLTGKDFTYIEYVWQET